MWGVLDCDQGISRSAAPFGSAAGEKGDRALVYTQADHQHVGLGARMGSGAGDQDDYREVWLRRWRDKGHEDHSSRPGTQQLLAMPVNDATYVSRRHAHRDQRGEPTN